MESQRDAYRGRLSLLSNTRGIYTGIIFIAAISFEPRLMQWFLMSELKQPSPPLCGLTRRGGIGIPLGPVFLPFHPRCDAIFSLKRFICEPRRGAALPPRRAKRAKGRGLDRTEGKKDRNEQSLRHSEERRGWGCLR